MSGLFAPGMPRIALLDANGNKLKTLYLPPPPKNKGVTLEWVEKAFYTDLIDGSESCRRLGWIPQIVLKYQAYNDILPLYGIPIGGNDGNLADITSLMSLLDSAPGTLKASPGPSAGGFVVNRVNVSAMGVAGSQGTVTDLTLTLRGGSIYSAKTLGAF